MAGTAAGGVGVSLNGLLCGCVSSVAIGTGMRYGRTSPEENPKPVWDMVDRYVAEFKDRFGALNCGQLIGFEFED